MEETEKSGEELELTAESKDVATEETDVEAVETAEAEESEEQEKPKKKGGFQKKLEKQSAIISEQARAIEDLRAQMSKGTAPAVTEGKPKLEDFDSHADFTEALADWKYDQREKGKVETQKKESAKSEVDKIAKSYSENVSKFKETVEDWDDVEEVFEDTPASPALTEAIVTSDQAAEVQYHLAKNPELLEKINKMSYRDVAKEIGKIELRLSLDKESKEELKPKISNAPAPLRTVSGKTAAVPKRLEDMDFKEYAKHMDDQQFKAQRR